ncbi:MAG: hypothetical protein ACKVOQ_07085 [Cyclobacteriaceae bacterium]|jgi:hypothetical protein
MEAAKLKLKSKKLVSGKFQVNFSTEGHQPNFYGYLLAEPFTPVQEVIDKINRHVDSMNNRPRYFQRNLFSLGNREVNSGKILIFQK